MRRLDLLAGRRRLSRRRRLLASWRLSTLFLHRRRHLALRRLDLLTHRRRLTRWGLSLLTRWRKVLRTGSRDRLVLLALGRCLPRSVWLGLSLDKGRRRTRPHGWGYRTNLLRVDRLDLHPRWRRILAGLGAQGL